jgi:hypothetical protein
MVGESLADALRPSASGTLACGQTIRPPESSSSLCRRRGRPSFSERRRSLSRLFSSGEAPSIATIERLRGDVRITLADAQSIATEGTAWFRERA